MKIKASRIDNLTDARYFAAQGVEWMGYCLDESTPGYVPPKLLAAIREWVDGPRTVGEFGLATADEVLQAIADCHLDAVQVGPFVPLTDLEVIRSRAQVLRELVVQHDTTPVQLQEAIAEAAHLAEATILSFRTGGIAWVHLQAGHPFGVEALQDMCVRWPILLDLSFDASALPQLLVNVQPYGLVLYGSAEEKIGYKSFDELDAVFEALFR